MPTDPLSSARRCEPPQLPESPQSRTVLPPFVYRRSTSASRISGRCPHFHQLSLRLGGPVVRWRAPLRSLLHQRPSGATPQTRFNRRERRSICLHFFLREENSAKWTILDAMVLSVSPAKDPRKVSRDYS
ncbi:leucine-rich repeat extensin-like protein 3 [Iris pallida]|uniref:Leucine-rich repeat extensin-like protein 3 n=1 Tax=Iris pallida TaxID=29817 RepID=A0AAX6GN26_IRIPA|nr:leucine-rich repeat extensin-like protein 3 [Iris pallida]